MGRPRQFDEDRALERALELFWRRGYANTSVRDLGEAMGIRRGTLYASFGDKETVFLRALERYRDRWREVIRRHLEGAGTPRSRLVALLEEMARQIASDDLARGCLLVNSSFEVEALPARARTLVAESLGALEASLRATLERAQEAGEIDPGKDAAATARLLVAALGGARGLWKLDRDPDRVTALLRLAIETL